MNQAKTRKFISACRKEKKLTQAQLAEKLNITDRAVSKWETGKSMPDASIMLELCEILGITVNELLNGEKACTERYEKKTDKNLTVQKGTDNNILKKNIIISAVFSAALLTGITVCLICDFAISGTLTWSSIPVSSSVMAWLITFPSIVFGKKGIKLSLISLSIFTVPYLYLLSIINKNKKYILNRYSDISNFDRIPVAYIRGIYHHGKSKKTDCFRYNFFIGNSVYNYYQYNTVWDDRRTPS